METSPRTALQDAGLRATDGRVAVLNALALQAHVDAEHVYQRVSQDLPTTSIQSVHNILTDLTGAGLIRRIEPAHSPARYEIRVGDNHHHIVCERCGTVADVDCAVGEAPCLTPSDKSGFTVHSAEVTFWGLCQNCQVIPV